MHRRNFVMSAAAAGTAGGLSAASPAKNAILEMRYYRLRTGFQAQRTQEFLSKDFMPAAQRAGIGPMGFFSPVIGEGSPFILCVLSYPSLAGMESAQEKLASDKEYAAAVDAFSSGPEIAFTRVESSLLRAFDSIPNIEAPPTDGKRAPRIFELRVYESKSPKAGKTKIKMFDDAEIAIFRKLGMTPVFFGETIVGRNMPNLAYMLAFDSLAARDKAWSAFGADPDWQKLRAQPGLSDPEIVSNISNSILRPTGFSPIR